MLLEGQITYQPHLVACQRYIIKQFNERLRQCLFEDYELVYMPLESFTAEIHRTGDSTELRSIESLHHITVNEECHIVIRATDGQHPMMPIVVSIAVGHRPLLLRGSEQCSTLLCLEPQHYCHIIHSRSAKQVTVQLHRIAVESEREALLPIPRASVEIERCAVCIIRHRLALAFVHAVVRQQFALVARQRMIRCGSNLLQCQCFRPDTRLQHIALVRTAKAEKCTMLDIERNSRVTEDGVGHVLCSGIETYIAFRLVIYAQHTHVGKYIANGLRRIAGDRIRCYTLQAQAVVPGEQQLLGYLTIACLKEHHIRCAVRF